MVYLPPGLALATPVYITVWLNRNGYFEMKARLDSGEELPSVILRGEQNQRIINDTDLLEGQVESERALVGPVEQQEYERIRSRIYEALSRGELETAEGKLQDLVAFRDRILERRHPVQPEQTLEERARIQINNARYVATEYAWAIGADAPQLLTMARELEYALEHRNRRAMENGVSHTRDQVVRTLGYGPGQNMTMAGYIIWLFMEIDEKIAPKDPDLADHLSERLVNIIEQVKRGDLSARTALERLSSDVSRETERIERESEYNDGCVPCDTCGARNLPGARICQGCGETQGLLATRKGLGYYSR